MEKTSAPDDQRAIIVSIDLLRSNQNDLEQFNSSEFIELARSSGLIVKHHIFSKQNFVSASHFLTKGKADELKNIVELENIKLVVLDCELSPSQERNLEKLLCARVLDRTGLILDIFAARAQSDIGKLQVELAQLSFLSTRLVRGWSHLERQKGGIGLRGPGETQLETDRRLIGNRIKQLKKKLDKQHNQKNLNRYSRRKGSNKLVALVGYTNAGKTSLFNMLTKGGLEAEDKLFATLDTTTRRADFKFKTLETVLFSDTVGFISNLPTKLVESFKATLDDLASADLLIHVIDAADTNRDYKIKEVDLILDDLGVTSMPQIRALNKIDLIANEDIWPANNLHPEIKISSKTGEGLKELKNIVSEMLFGGLLCGWVHFSPVQASVRSRLFDSGCILEEKTDSNGHHQSLVSISQSMLEQFEEIEIFKNLKPVSP
ncbi:GTPase HflX [Gammaproteobacteria bacterium]|nr:GTPase HflX [Gammaproteobacteria bacterium]MDB2678021.1 GTPase HflX [Gammaproteobacteria bacterium]MDC3228329.1 GTPase HflX [Gammaproteobacteria bacterium]